MQLMKTEEKYTHTNVFTMFLKHGNIVYSNENSTIYRSPVELQPG